MQRSLEADIAIVGSGAAGATLARELSLKGKKVVLLEKGPDWEWPIGHWIAYPTLYNIHRSKEGVIIRRGVCTGGSTMIYSGNAFNPPAGFMDKLGIDFSEQLSQARQETGVSVLPESFYKDWKSSKRLVESAAELGLDMKLQEKFIDPARCKPGCDDCLLGCKRGAKWTSRPYIEEALQNRAELLVNTSVQKVVHENGRAVGVLAKDKQGEVFVSAERVVLSAGGIGTPVILQNSGIENAGTNFFTDPMSILFGKTKQGMGARGEMTYTFASEDHLGEFIIGTTSANNTLAAQLIRHPLKALPRLPSLPRAVGMFVKLCDSAGGRIHPDGSISKPLSELDHKRMEKGIDTAGKIMAGAGVEPDSIMVARYIGGHPGGTAGVGRVVDRELKTEIEGLYVCDASVIPESPGVPLVLILVSLAKWFAARLAK